MSIDFMVYVKDLSGFSREQCDAYISSLGFSAQLCPDFDHETHGGFLPFQIVPGFLGGEAGKQILVSGFEYDFAPYEPEPAPKPGFWSRLFGKPAKITPFEEAIRESSYLVNICCSSSDSFEVLLAYGFAAYLSANFGGILDDPQTGQFYSDPEHIERELRVMMEELREEQRRGDLKTHGFPGWDRILGG